MQFNFKNIVSNSIRMYNLASLVSKCSQQFQLPKCRCNQRQNAPLASVLLFFSQQFQLQEHRFKQHQNAQFIVLNFKVFPGVPSSENNIFLQRQNASSIVLAFNIFSLFQLPKTSFKLHKNAPLLSLVSTLSQQCQLWLICQCFM